MFQTKRQMQALATKNKILDKGWELLHQKGFDNITIQELADICGIAKGTFYLYFESKEALLRDLERLPYQRFLEKLDDLSDLSLLEKLTRYIEQWFKVRDELGPYIMRSWLSYYVQGPADDGMGRRRSARSHRRHLQDCL